MPLPALISGRTPLILALVLATTAALPCRAEQLLRPEPPSPVSVHDAFHFSAEARHSLRALWQVSVGAGQERVACIGGHTENGIVYITRVQGLIPSGADSMHISAIASLEQCVPPEWVGTVHTHITHYQGMPYTLFSKDDRIVMTMWRRQWRQPGTFCVLFSDWEASCESGYDNVSRAAYGSPRGNIILP